ncbi:hypothetical protein MA16_Dca027485 [Dendrobium catenatum]|uniref:Uncharacterized protein n=1 Tax=Dendrobium catenatum TaxID=906689 RepID=A0A2I0VB03_9ASPA|nr:hypothetical protein MA16_Dca027485 [Dendrobium catenatum]
MGSNEVVEFLKEVQGNIGVTPLVDAASLPTVEVKEREDEAPNSKVVELERPRFQFGGMSRIQNLGRSPVAVDSSRVLQCNDSTVTDCALRNISNPADMLVDRGEPPKTVGGETSGIKSCPPGVRRNANTGILGSKQEAAMGNASAGSVLVQGRIRMLGGSLSR